MGVVLDLGAKANESADALAETSCDFFKGRRRVFDDIVQQSRDQDVFGIPNPVEDECDSRDVLKIRSAAPLTRLPRMSLGRESHGFFHSQRQHLGSHRFATLAQELP